MASTPCHTLCFTLVQVFSPTCYYWSGIPKDGGGEKGFAQIYVLFRRRYEDVKGFIWWSDWLVGLRRFIADQGGVGGTRSICRGQLERFNHTKLSLGLEAMLAWITYGLQP